MRNIVCHMCFPLTCAASYCTSLLTGDRVPSDGIVPRPPHQGTPEALPSPILSRMSSTSQTRAVLRRAAGAASAAGEGWPPAEACGQGAGRKRLLDFLYVRVVIRR